MKTRGFEIVTRYKEADIQLPIRQTSGSAGYDIEAAERIVIPSIWKRGVLGSLMETAAFNSHDLQQAYVDAPEIKPVLVPTGLKCYMPVDEYLQLTCRSSSPIKRSLMLPNGVGIVDSDYYNNPNNEGEIFVQILNFGLEDVVIEKGERIAQGIFLRYLKVDEDTDNGKQRVGGFGSSDQ